MLKSNPSRYGAVPVTIHWLTAILILMAIITGFRAGGSMDLAAKAAFLRVHIPAAIVILLLTWVASSGGSSSTRSRCRYRDRRLGRNGSPAPCICSFMS